MTQMILCRLSRREAEYLMMAPAVAGGWVAVHPDCREAVTEALGDVADFLALLPADWGAVRRPVTAEQATRIAARLDAHAAYSVMDEPEVPAEFAERVRAHLAH